MKKSIVAAALVLGLLVVGCNNNADPTPDPVVDAVESIAAEAQDALASMAAEAEDEIDAAADDAADAIESMLPEASPAA